MGFSCFTPFLILIFAEEKYITMEQWTAPDCGTLRITNPKTLEKWILSGKYQEKVDEGYHFGLGCGRFRTEVCVCSACKKHPKKELEKIIINKVKL